MISFDVGDLTPWSPSYVEVSQAKGGTLCLPLQNFYIFQAIAMKFGTDETVKIS